MSRTPARSVARIIRSAWESRADIGFSVTTWQPLAAAAKGCHVVTEKPMSARLSQAERMIRATERAGVRLMVNWPTAWSPAWQEFERLLLDGAIGPITYLKYRSA